MNERQITLILEAGDSAYRRGEIYYKEGRVKDLKIGSSQARARVRGSKIYHPLLRWSGGFDGECECLEFRDVGFCKHLVAVALAVIDHKWPSNLQKHSARLDSNNSDYAKSPKRSRTLQVIWKDFKKEGWSCYYWELVSRADALKQGKLWRKKAQEYLKALHEKARKLPDPSAVNMATLQTSRELIEIYIGESKMTAAWKLAQTYGCCITHGKRLAEWRDRKHPAEAIAFYQSLVEDSMMPRSREAHLEALKFVERIQLLSKQTKQTRKFSIYRKRLEKKFRNRKHFIRLLKERLE